MLFQMTIHHLEGNMKKALFVLLALVLVLAISCSPEHEHKYEEKTVPATCTKDGKTSKVCSCGAEIEVVKIPATGHSEDLILEVGAEPTEEKEGYYNYVCPVCEEVVKTEVIPVLSPRTIFVPKNVELKKMSNEKYQEIEDWFPSISGSETNTYITKLDEAKFKEGAKYTFTNGPFNSLQVTFSGSGSVYVEIVEGGTTTIKITGNITTTDSTFGTVEGVYENAVITIDNEQNISYKPQNSITLTGLPNGIKNEDYLGMVLMAFNDIKILKLLDFSGYRIDETKRSDGSSSNTMSEVTIYDKEGSSYYIFRIEAEGKVFDSCRVMGESGTLKTIYLKYGQDFYDPASVDALV